MPAVGFQPLQAGERSSLGGYVVWLKSPGRDAFSNSYLCSEQLIEGELGGEIKGSAVHGGESNSKVCML